MASHRAMNTTCNSAVPPVCHQCWQQVGVRSSVLCRKVGACLNYRPYSPIVRDKQPYRLPSAEVSWHVACDDSCFVLGIASGRSAATLLLHIDAVWRGDASKRWAKVIRVPIRTQTFLNRVPGGRLVQVRGDRPAFLGFGHLMWSVKRGQLPSFWCTGCRPEGSKL